MCTDQTSVNWQDSWGGILQAGQTNSTESLGIQGLPALRCSLKPSLTWNVRQEDKFGLGFQLKEGVENVGRSPGSYSWAGINNTHFWADPDKGIAAVLLTQVLPFYDDRCIDLLLDFERCIYRNLE